MAPIPTDFYARYGLQNVRAAMKRPFEQAFPDRTLQAPERPSPPSLPQLRSRMPSRQEQWQWHVEDGHGQVVKRRRIEATRPPPPASPAASVTFGVPGLYPRPDGSARPGQVTSQPSSQRQVSREGTAASKEPTEAELAQCAALLNLDSTTGVPFLKSVIAKDAQSFCSEAEGLAYAKKLIGLVNSLACMMEAGAGGLSASLGATLVQQATRCLRSLHARKEGDGKSSLALQIESWVLALFNDNGAAYRKMKEHGASDHPNAYRFAGGKAKFRFIGWCVEKNIRLSDKELRCLDHMECPKNLKDYEAFLVRVRHLVDAFEEHFAQLARSEKNSS